MQPVTDPASGATMDSGALALCVVLGVALFLVRRQNAAVPFLLGIIFLPIGQPIVIGSLHLFTFRLLIVFGWLRLLFRGEFHLPKFRSTDWTVVAFVAVSSLSYALLRQTGEGVMNALGSGFNAVGAYFLFRCLIRNLDDVGRAARLLSLLSILVAVIVVTESLTGRNLFSGFSGLDQITEIRDGRVRAQGPFGHSILAGTFGAITFPLNVSLWWQRRGRLWALVGSVSSVAIVACSACSGPVISLVMGMVGLGLWPLRSRMRLVRWLLLLLIVCLQLAMNAPIWALVGRAAIFGSSSSDHRFRILDSFIRNFDQWWLLGTANAANWGWMTWDVSNNYVRVGVDGGLAALLLFVVIVIYSFKAVGHGLRHTQKHPRSQRLVWGLGVMLFAHLVAFIGVNYWDQSIVVWYLSLAMISALPAAPILQRTPAASPIEFQSCIPSMS